MKKVLLFLADGCEEVEAVTPIDFLRRAGVAVTTVGISGKIIHGAHGIDITADIELSEMSVSDYDGIIFPGGMPGAENIAAVPDILKVIEDFNAAGKLVAAICASPGVILAKTSVLNGKKATCYPGFEARFGEAVEACSDNVVVDGNLVTSRGPGTVAEFSIELIKLLAGADIAEEIKKGTLQGF